MTNVRQASVGLWLILCTGCGSGLVPVEGQVVWKDGKPAVELKDSMIIFDLPEKKTGARGSVKADGTFTLATARPEDGVLPGDYKVLIMEAARPSSAGAESTEPGKNLLDLRYSNPATTDLKVTIKPGQSKVTLTVERAKK